MTPKFKVGDKVRYAPSQLAIQLLQEKGFSCYNNIIGHGIIKDVQSDHKLYGNQISFYYVVDFIVKRYSKIYEIELEFLKRFKRKNEIF